MSAPPLSNRVIAFAARSIGLLVLTILINVGFSAKAAEAATASGILNDVNGTFIPNATVTISGPSGTVATTTTDLLGSYSLSVPSSSNYMIAITGARGTTGAFVPDNFTLSQPVDLTNDATVNFSPACNTLTLSLRDSSGNPPVISLYISMSNDRTSASFTSPAGATVYYGNATNSANHHSDGSGDGTFTTLSNSNYTVGSSGNSGYGYNQASGTGSIGTTDATKTLTVVTNRKTFSGTIVSRGKNGTDTPVDNVLVTLSNGTGPYSATATTDSLGQFSFTAGGITNFYVTFARSGTQNDNALPGDLISSAYIDLTSNRNYSIIYEVTSYGASTVDSLGRSVVAPVRLQATSTDVTLSGYPGATVFKWRLNSNFSDTGSVNGLFHERWLPKSANATVVASTTTGYYGQNTGTYTSNTNGLTLTLPATITSPFGSLSLNTTGTNPVLSWTYTVNPGDYFNVYRNGALIGTTTSTSYTDTSVSNGGTNTYFYYVASVPANAGAETAKSMIARAGLMQ